MSERFAMQNSDSQEELRHEVELVRHQIALLQERNKRVEADKAWEVSLTRKLALLTLTYLITAGVFYCIGVEHFLLNAIIPSCGYILSTLTLPAIKSWWLQSQQK